MDVRIRPQLTARFRAITGQARVEIEQVGQKRGPRGILRRCQCWVFDDPLVVGWKIFFWGFLVVKYVHFQIALACSELYSLDKILGCRLPIHEIHTGCSNGTHLDCFGVQNNKVFFFLFSFLTPIYIGFWFRFASD